MLEAGVQHITTSAYHPQAIGMVERIHHTLKAALCARAQRGGGRCLEGSPAWVLLGMHATPQGRVWCFRGRGGPTAAAGGTWSAATTQ